MRRSPAIVTGVTTIFLSLLVLAGCGGGGSKSSTPTVAKVVISPSAASLDIGGITQFTATPQDSSGNAVTLATVTFAAKNTDANDTATPFVSITPGGLACAGTWDSLTTPVVCTPNPRNGGVGAALITATANGVTSDPVTVYVHKHVENIVISPSRIDCLSQTKTQQFTAKAFAQGSDVTASIGTFNWTENTGGKVATIGASTGLVTAVGPGATQIFANVSGTQSTSATFITCPVKQIKIHVKDSTETSATLANAASSTLAADVIDRNDQPMTNITLRWNSSQPLVGVAGTGTVQGGAAGTATITASCTSPDCNTNLPDIIYSNAFLTTVTGTSSTTVYAGSTQSTSLLPIDTTTNQPATTAITLSDKPNSMLFNTRGTTLYVGTATNLNVVDMATNTVATPTQAVPGKVLAVSPDGNVVLVSDNTKVYAFLPTATSGSVITLPISGAVSAAFAPDNSKVYIVGNGQWTVWNTSITPVPQTVAGANDVSFLATGAFGYIAASGSGVGVKATCDNSSAGTVGTSGVPTQIRALPNGTQLVALAAPNIDLITADSENIGCPPGVSNTATATSLAGSFVPRQLIVTPDGRKAYVTSDQGGVLLGYDVATRTRSPIQLSAGVTQTFTGGVTLDSKQLYVGTNNGVHRLDLTTGQDAQTITVSLGTDNPAPDLVAVRPK